MRTVLFLAALVAAPFTWLVWPHCWLKDRSVAVTIDGKSADYARIYNGGESLFVDLDSDGEYYYVVYPERKELGVAINNRFLHLPGFIISRDLPATYVPLGKLELGLRHSFGDRMVEFTEAEYGRLVKLEW